MIKHLLPTAASLILFASNAMAQNLVPNPGFEAANRKPDNKANSINRAKDWMAPIANADYYMKDAGKKVGTPKNVFGKQKPHSGNAYAGICTRTKFLEYIEAKLTDTLKKDQEYLVELYISRAERSLGSVKEFGVFFSPKKLWGFEGIGLPYKPQIVFTNRKGYKNKKKWIKLSAVYKAEGNEIALIFGHFNDPSGKKQRLYCHYYIDDVSVVPIGSKQEPALVDSTVEEPVAKAFAPKLGEAVTLETIFFETNKSELLPGSFTELEKLAHYLAENPHTVIQLSGHTDNSGNETQNKLLSESRARSVADYLRSKGIEEGRISYAGLGSARPVASNEMAEGRQMNRRVEFVLMKK